MLLYRLVQDACLSSNCINVHGHSTNTITITARVSAPSRTGGPPRHPTHRAAAPALRNAAGRGPLGPTENSTVFRQDDHHNTKQNSAVQYFN